MLTGGGDCPGLNEVIRAVVCKGISLYGYTVTGIFEGWKRLLDEGLIRPLSINDAQENIHRGATILRSSRTNPFNVENGIEMIRNNLKSYDIGAVIAIEGKNTRGDGKAWRRRKFGNMVALKSGEIVPFTPSKVKSQTKTVDPELIETAEVFFG